MQQGGREHHSSLAGTGWALAGFAPAGGKGACVAGRGKGCRQGMETGEGELGPFLLEAIGRVDGRMMRRAPPASNRWRHLTLFLEESLGQIDQPHHLIWAGRASGRRPRTAPTFRAQGSVVLDVAQLGAPSTPPLANSDQNRIK